MRNCVAVRKLKTMSTVEWGPTIIRVSHRVSSRQARERRRRGIPHPGEVCVVVKVAEVLSSSFRALPQCAS